MIDNSVMNYSVCPYCGKQNDRVSSIDEETKRPKKGDVSICIKCTGISIFDEKGELYKPSEEEMELIKYDEKEWDKLVLYRSYLLYLNTFMPDMNPN